MTSATVVVSTTPGRAAPAARQIWSFLVFGTVVAGHDARQRPAVAVTGPHCGQGGVTDGEVILMVAFGGGQQKQRRAGSSKAGAVAGFDQRDQLVDMRRRGAGLLGVGPGQEPVADAEDRARGAEFADADLRSDIKSPPWP